jgi:hypothetical protein
MRIRIQTGYKSVVNFVIYYKYHFWGQQQQITLQVASKEEYPLVFMPSGKR